MLLNFGCSLCRISTLFSTLHWFVVLEKLPTQSMGQKIDRKKDFRPENASQLAQHRHHRWVGTIILSGLHI